MINTDDYINKLPFEKKRKDPDAHAAYNAEEKALYVKFKKDALQDVGLTGHAKAEAAFSLAWEYGHSSGYHEVYRYLCDLSDLLLRA